MDSRLILHEKLVSILGSRQVYFQPPESIKLSYPCIVYSRKRLPNTYAGNSVYKQDHGYEIIVIDTKPDSRIVDEISRFENATFDRHYTSSGLNHDVFTIFFDKIN